MPNLETFFEFGGTVELLTTADTTLEKYDIIMSELMWGVDQGLRDKTGTIKVQERDEMATLYSTTRMLILSYPKKSTYIFPYSYLKKFSGLNSTIPQTAR